MHGSPDPQSLDELINKMVRYFQHIIHGKVHHPNLGAKSIRLSDFIGGSVDSLPEMEEERRRCWRMFLENSRCEHSTRSYEE